MSGHTDYTAMDGLTMLSACRDDAAKWAAAFCQHAKKLGHSDIDEGWMIGWFANAIEQSHAVRVTYPESNSHADLVRALEDLNSAMRFVLAFYEPGQRYLDTNAWKSAEAGARDAHQKATAALATLTARKVG